MPRFIRFYRPFVGFSGSTSYLSLTDLKVRFRNACAFILEQRGIGIPNSRQEEQVTSLERLSKLRSSGALSESEFATMKKRLMGSL
jgi:hypothetical protein